MIDRRTLLLSLGASSLALTPLSEALAARSSWPLPPQPRKQPTTVGRFGHQRSDDYAWMRPKDWHAVLRNPASLDGEIKAHVLAENAYVAAMMKPAKGLQKSLMKRMEELEKGTRPEPFAIEDRGFEYYQRDDGDYVVYARRPVSGGDEQILLDAGAEARGKTFYFVHWSGGQRSQDGRLFGWAADETGSGIFTLRARDMNTGRDAMQPITNAHGGFAFSPDSRYVFWVGRDEHGRPRKVFRHDIAAGSDTLIHEESDGAFFVYLKTTASGRFVKLHIMNGAMSEVRLVPMDAPTSPPILVEPRTDGLTYDVDDWNGKLVILTDADGAVDMKVVTTEVAAAGRANWKLLEPHWDGRLITAMHCFAGHLVLEEKFNAKPRLLTLDTKGNKNTLKFDEEAFAITVPAGQPWDAASLTFEYQSPRTPVRVCKKPFVSETDNYTLAGARTIYNYDSSRYEVRRLNAKAADGAEIPITVLKRKGVPLDGMSPLYLYGYGSYGNSTEAEFSPFAITLVDQGWTYAIAHVRGGSERGNNWWRSVLKHGKKTTFTDFISCAEYLIEQKYTAKQRIVAHGLSAGGLMMGAIYNMRPDLWAGVIAQVPFVDVLNTMDDFETHPLGTTALPIWGDPRVPEDYEYCASYSPYDNVKAAAYPALLATGGVADDRVAFWEPVKFAAKVRSLTTAKNPIMVKTYMTAGHMGETGAAAARERNALFASFAIYAGERKWGEVPQRA